MDSTLYSLPKKPCQEAQILTPHAREDGHVESYKDVLDWLKYAQSETTGIKLGFSKGEAADLDAQIDAAWRESVEEEVNRRLGCARTRDRNNPPCREIDSSTNELHARQ